MLRIRKEIKSKYLVLVLWIGLVSCGKEEDRSGFIHFIYVPLILKHSIIKRKKNIMSKLTLIFPSY